MNERILDKKSDNPAIAQKHIDKYIYDLQNHFNLSDVQIVKVLNGCINSVRKKNTSKKWWQFF